MFTYLKVGSVESFDCPREADVTLTREAWNDIFANSRVFYCGLGRLRQPEGTLDRMRATSDRMSSKPTTWQFSPALEASKLQNYVATLTLVHNFLIV